MNQTLGTGHNYEILNIDEVLFLIKKFEDKISLKEGKNWINSRIFLKFLTQEKFTIKNNKFSIIKLNNQVNNNLFLEHENNNIIQTKDNEKEFRFFESELLDNTFIDIEHIVDWFNYIENNIYNSNVNVKNYCNKIIKKLYKMNFDIVLKYANSWLEKITKNNFGSFGKIKNVLDIDENYSWFELFDSVALDKEGSIMKHCVGSYDLAQSNLNGHNVRIFSLKDKYYKSYVTIEVRNNIVIQVKGFANSSPLFFRNYILIFLNYFSFENENSYQQDLKNIGLSFSNNSWFLIEKVFEKIDKFDFPAYGQEKTIYIFSNTDENNLILKATSPVLDWWKIENRKIYNDVFLAFNTKTKDIQEQKEIISIVNKLSLYYASLRFPDQDNLFWLKYDDLEQKYKHIFDFFEKKQSDDCLTEFVLSENHSHIINYFVKGSSNLYSSFNSNKFYNIKNIIFKNKTNEIIGFVTSNYYYIPFENNLSDKEIISLKNILNNNFVYEIIMDEKIFSTKENFAKFKKIYVYHDQEWYIEKEVCQKQIEYLNEKKIDISVYPWEKQIKIEYDIFSLKNVNGNLIDKLFFFQWSKLENIELLISWLNEKKIISNQIIYSQKEFDLHSKGKGKANLIIFKENKWYYEQINDENMENFLISFIENKKNKRNIMKKERYNSFCYNLIDLYPLINNTVSDNGLKYLKYILNSLIDNKDFLSKSLLNKNSRNIEHIIEDYHLYWNHFSDSEKNIFLKFLQSYINSHIKLRDKSIFSVDADVASKISNYFIEFLDEKYVYKIIKKNRFSFNMKKFPKSLGNLYLEKNYYDIGYNLYSYIKYNFSGKVEKNTYNMEEFNEINDFVEKLKLVTYNKYYTNDIIESWNNIINQKVILDKGEETNENTNSI